MIGEITAKPIGQIAVEAKKGDFLSSGNCFFSFLQSKQSFSRPCRPLNQAPGVIVKLIQTTVLLFGQGNQRFTGVFQLGTHGNSAVKVSAEQIGNIFYIRIIRKFGFTCRAIYGFPFLFCAFRESLDKPFHFFAIT